MASNRSPDQSGPAPAARDNRGALPALAFATTVAMWAAGYICRFPAVQAPAPLLLVLMLACLFFGGYLAGKLTGGGTTMGARVGAVASLINLLVLGSVLGGSGGGLVPSAVIWIPGSLVLGAILGAAGGAAGGRRPAGGAPRWTGLFAVVGATATFLLVIAGGIVTSSESGLAVVDWPNSFGYNMFLYPLSRMSGGIYYEHAHRLLGSLVGLTTLVLAVQIWRLEKGRRGLKGLALLAVLCVVVQGVLGGLRVTGQPTLSTSPADMSPDIHLAVIHGIFGQLFLGLMVGILVMTGRRWAGSGAPRPHRSAGTDRALSLVLLAAVIGQITLGALLRHMSWGLAAHIIFAFVVLGLAMTSGLRAAGIYAEVPTLRKMGNAIVGIASTQVLLGFAALGVIGIEPKPGPPGALEITLATVHQAFGAFLLAHVVMLVAWLRRLVVPETETAHREREE